MSIGLYILDDDGNPVEEPEVLVWAKWFEEHRRETQIAQTIFPWGRVSTIFLAMDHNYMEMVVLPEQPVYKPILWETMIFGGELDMEQCRYRSREEAIEGHAEWVKRAIAARRWWRRILDLLLA